ncbi:LysE family translocator [Vibrio sp. S17_S38]|uniref:LysE family translocator n=1 Tax=Vibrio sp. S17_S38 TaxID=2720229 RepID=UPI001681BC14|nr:LysE family translocator [Vibrio sp. S17_S38]MBD1572582.1 LysE family translocator [Vibrio sp. S17_S38]
MELQQLLALLTFVLITTISPGPNNIMVMASGANIGFMRTIPHILGIIFGFSFMVIMVGIGLMRVFNFYPLLHHILNALCITYLFYLAWKIAQSKSNNTDEQYKAMSFIAAANFQWINPKAWTMAITAVSVYNTSENWQGVLFVSLMFALINVPSMSLWAFAGQKLQGWLSNPLRLKWFNYSMAGLLTLSVIPMVF